MVEGKREVPGLVIAGELPLRNKKGTIRPPYILMWTFL